jgi:hypothetical protein
MILMRKDGKILAVLESILVDSSMHSRTVESVEIPIDQALQETAEAIYYSCQGSLDEQLQKFFWQVAVLEEEGECYLIKPRRTVDQMLASTKVFRMKNDVIMEQQNCLLLSPAGDDLDKCYRYVLFTINRGGYLIMWSETLNMFTLYLVNRLGEITVKHEEVKGCSRSKALEQFKRDHLPAAYFMNTNEQVAG